MSVKKFYNLAKKKLYPLNRSLTGKGVKKTLNIIKKEFPKLKINKLKSGTKVFDWNIPPEWNISDAYVLDKFNKKIIDFKLNNLHIVGYSSPIDLSMTFKQLKDHLHYLEDKPDAIHYLTSYYKKTWGFCLSYNQYKGLNKKKKECRNIITNSLKGNKYEY